MVLDIDAKLKIILNPKKVCQSKIHHLKCKILVLLQEYFAFICSF